MKHPAEHPRVELREIIKNWTSKYAGNPKAEELSRAFAAHEIGITEVCKRLDEIDRERV